MRRAAGPRLSAAGRRRPLRTRDGRVVRLLCNAARADEVVAGLAAGAEGLGLLRTELAFLGATGWPSEAEHLAALEPVLAPLRGHLATVRTLDFGADKTPPFLGGVAERGVALTLRYPEALLAQLRAIVWAGAATRLRVKLPLVEDAEQVAAGRRLLAEAIAAVGWSAAAPPLLGASIETPGAVERIEQIAAASDFVSIGTNDLAAYALGQDRARPLAAVRAAGDPRVLALIRRVVAPAHERGLAVEVRGEAAGDPELAGRLVEAGVDELSMAPPRLEAVRAAIRRVTAGRGGEDRGRGNEGQSAALHQIPV